LKNKYIVFDRDGTLINYKPYLSNPDDVKLSNGAKDFLNNLISNSNMLFLHTNQSGVSKGYFKFSQVKSCNDHMIKLLDFKKNIFERICIATELNLSPDSYRKPSPLFGNKILEDYKIDKSDLIYIGDNMTDLETAHNIGCKAYGIINDKLSPNVSMNSFGFKTFKDLNKLNQYLYG
jgi:D-glycero-D-manno-heptose 1,7-bisphosphate phosphatase